jgi:tetratricopeptide (TPR) repeat protein
MSRLQTSVCTFLLLVSLSGCTRSPEARKAAYLKRGRAFLQKHDYAKAILEFRNAAQIAPKDPEPDYLTGVAYQDSDSIGAAIASFQRALRKNPKHTGAQLKLAQIMAAASEKRWIEEANHRLLMLKRSGSDSPEVLDTLALTELKLGEIEDAVQHLNEVLAHFPLQLQASVLLSQARLQQHDLKGALAVLEKACAKAPKSADPHIALANLYIAEKMPSQAEAELRRALALDPQNHSALFDLASLQVSLGRAQQAEENFRRLSASGDPRYQAVFAQFLFQQGRLNEALAEFQKLAKASPNDRTARTYLVAALQATGRLVEARKILNTALSHNAADLDALIQRAELSIHTGAYQSAESDLNQFLRLQPVSAQAHYLLAEIEAARGNSEACRLQLEDALRLNPYLLPARLDLARTLLRDRQAGAALEILDAAPAGQKQSVPLVIERNWALWATNNLTEMRKGIDQALAHERSADLLIQDGLWKLRMGHASAARASLEQALRLNPGDLRALAGLSKSYAQLGRSELALQAVQEYAQKMPSSAPIQEFLGTLLWAHGEHARARAAFEAAKAADPHFFPADFSLAQIDAAEGKWNDAAARMKQVLSYNPTLTTAHLWLGDIEWIKGDSEGAIQEYQRVVDANPHDAVALNNLAYLLAEYRKQPDTALKFAERAVELAPDDPNCLDTLGWILYRKGLYSPAIPYLKRAITQSPNAILKYHLAMAYAKSGARNSAQQTLARALKDNPRLPEAKLAQVALANQN